MGKTRKTRAALQILDDYDTPEKRVVAWNSQRDRNPNSNVYLGSACFDHAELPGINLKHLFIETATFMKCNLKGAKFDYAMAADTNFSGAVLQNAEFAYADLRDSNFTGVNLNRAVLVGANLCGANLFQADLTDADLYAADLSHAYLCGANLSNADLSRANLTNAVLHSTKFSHAICTETTFLDVDLRKVDALDKIQHAGPCPISTSTFDHSSGQIPDIFLRGCGLSPWQLLAVRLHDPDLSPADFADIQQRIFDERMKGYFLNGIFISYSRNDEGFVDKLYGRLREEGANVWLDREHAVAGSLEKQVHRAIRLNDIVVLVLSEASVQSDWVEAELDWARTKEKDTGREVLCPIALDDSWKEKVQGSVLWRKVKEKNVLDFSKWQTGGFNPQFEKLIRGMKVNY